MNLRAKMTVTEVKSNPTQEVVTLGCVYSNTPEDNSFAKSTPCGTMTLTIDNPAAQAVLLPGKSYYVNISPCTDTTSVGSGPAPAAASSEAAAAPQLHAGNFHPGVGHSGYGR